MCGKLELDGGKNLISEYVVNSPGAEGVLREGEEKTLHGHMKNRRRAGKLMWL